MSAAAESVAIRFSRRELELIRQAVDAMPPPSDPADERLVVGLRALFAQLPQPEHRR